MSEPTAAPESPAPPRPKKRRRWRAVLLILVVLLGVAAVLVNGPGARWFVGKILRDQLARQGLSGEVTVEGRLWSGFTLRDVRFTGGETIQVIRFRNLGVRYQLPALRKKRIEGLFGNDIEVVMQPAPPDEEDEADAPREDADLRAIAKSIRGARALALPVALDFEGITFRLLRPEGDPLEVALDSLRHEAGSESFTIGAIRSNALGEDALASQDLTIEWGEESLRLSRLDVMPDLALASLEARFPAGGPLDLAATVLAAGSRFEATIDADGTLLAELTGDPLDLGPVAGRFAPDLDLTGTIRRFRLEAGGLDGPRESWTASVELESGPVTIKEREIPALTAAAAVGERLEVTVATPAGLRLTAQSRDDEFATRPPARWFTDLPIGFELLVPGIHEVLREAAPALGMELPDLATIPNGTVEGGGTLTIGGPRGVDAVDATWSLRELVVRDRPIPGLKGTAKLFGDLVETEVALAAPRPNESLALTAQYRLPAKAYKASASVALPDPSWLNPLLPGDDPLWRPAGPVALEWSGQGALEDKTHRGTLEVRELSLLAPEASVMEAELKASYRWPGTITAESLAIRNGDLRLEGGIAWDKGRLTIPGLRVLDRDGPLAGLEGGAPLAEETRSLDDFLKQDGPLDLRLNAAGLQLTRLAKLFPMKGAEDIAALFSCDLTLGGTPGDPTLAGSLRAREVRLPAPENLPVLAADLDLATRDGKLTATGEVTEPGGRILGVAASLPLRLKECLEDPDRFRSLPLDAAATITSFPLARLETFLPQLAGATDGTIDARISLTGPLADPSLAGNASVVVPRFELAGTPYRELRDARILIRLEDQRIVVDPSTVTVAGGRLTLSGTADPFGEEPALDLRLTAENALLWRDANLTARADAALALQGPLSAARLSGTVNIVESLFYKDIELIPFGAPAATAPEPRLPKVGRRKRGKILDLPSPVADWPLDIRIRTADPFLIRGNLAEGSATGDVTVTGTLSNPRPDGEIILREVNAQLPFSALEVKRGVIRLRPDAPLDPALEIRGTSNVQSHLIQLFLFGPLSDPKYSLVSSPPLPEAEILTLLATGTTVGDLNDPQLARGRAFQLLLADLRLKAAPADANPLLRLFRPVLNATRKLDLRVGDNDPFSGRQFNSTTVELGGRWFATIQIDAFGHSRGLIRYSTRSTR